MASRHVVLSSIDPFSYGKILGALLAVAGLVQLILFRFFITDSLPQTSFNFGGMMLGMIFTPLIYLVAGFIFGAIAAFFYNLLALFIGGVKLELDESVISRE